MAEFFRPLANAILRTIGEPPLAARKPQPAGTPAPSGNYETQRPPDDTAPPDIDAMRSAVGRHQGGGHSPVRPARMAPAFGPSAPMPVPDSFWREFLTRTKVELVTAPEREELHSLQKRWDELAQRIMELAKIRNGQNRAYRRGIEDRARQMADGKIEEVLEDPDAGWTKEDLRQDAAEKLRSAKIAMKHVTAAAIAIAQRIAKRVEAAAAKLVESEERIDVERYAAWKLEPPSRPTYVVALLRQLTWSPSKILPTPGLTNVSPKTLAPVAFM